MFTVKLGEKTYTVDRVTTRALREMDEAWRLFAKMSEALEGKGDPEDATTFAQGVDAMARWFVVFCGNLFSVDELLDTYPADRIVTDVALAMRSVVSQTTEALTAFPTGGVTEHSPSDHTVTSPTGSTTRCSRLGARLKRWTKRTPA